MSAPASDGEDPLLGTRVLDFELLAVLGSGGMSVVYRGRHHLTGQEVAIKVLLPELAGYAELKARFVEEARVLARLDHPNIVTLNNFTEVNGRLCLIMQFVEGMTFEQSIHQQGKVPVDEVLRVGGEVLRGLEYAHAQNVIHRDIKPSNVLLRTDGVVKVTDFGIAKIVGETHLTGTGQTMGTVRYMSPEQVRGKQLGPTSDLYSLSMTLYEALCGRAAFDGESQYAVMERQLNGVVPALSQFGALVPPELEAALRRALEKEPARRFPDAAAFRQALEHSSGTQTRSSPGELPARGRGRRFAAAFGVLVAAAGLGGAVLLRRERPRTVPASLSGPRPVATPGAVAPPPSWPAPYRIANVDAPTFSIIYQSEKLRVDFSGPHTADRLRDQVVAIRARLGKFLMGDPRRVVRDAAATAPPPLNLVLVPADVLDRPSLWPELHLTPGHQYPSRYMPDSHTLFLADTSRLEEELPYAVALAQVSATVAIADADCAELAEKFEASYRARSAK